MIYQVIYIDPHDKIYANIYLNIEYTTKVIDIKLKFEEIMKKTLNWYDFYYKINNKLLCDLNDLILSYIPYSLLENKFVYITIEKRKKEIIKLINNIKCIYENDINVIKEILNKAKNKQLINESILFDISYFFGGLFSIAAENYSIIKYANNDIKLNYKIYLKAKKINPNSSTIKYLNNFSIAMNIFNQ